ncbi:protein-disulfide reductase DsbD family protein [Verrucomicrobiales bacterium]|nr:protein-disulfide reductase DsbD family protein [Verrucomicrobiales bacterium]
MTQFIRTALRLLIIFVVILRGQSLLAQTTPVNFEFLSDSNNITDGQKFKLAIVASLEKDWHIYWKGSGESGQPTIIDWKAPDGFSTSSTSYPVPYKTEAFGLISHTYKNEAIFICEVTAPNDLEDKEYVFKAIVDWQACKEACLPPTVTELEIKLTKGQGDTSRSFTLIKSAWEKSHLQLPILNAVPVSDFGQLDISFNLTNEEINKIGKTPYFMPIDSTIIEEKEKQTIDIDGSVLTIFATLEDPEFKPAENIEGFLLGSEGAHSYWITTGQSTKPKKGLINHTISDQVVIPSKDSPEGKAYINAIKELSNGHKKETKSLSLMLLFAFLGGMILNLMPCVFPVLGIKVLGFVQQAGNDKSKIKYHGLSFAAGIIISLWALVSILFYIKSNGQSAGWGFQLQNPWFVWALIVIMYIFSLNLFGLFEIGTSLTSAGNKVQNKNGYLGSFLSGLLTVLVATPCTGPFMGPALALAISGPILQGYLLFTLLAIGLAFPYVILAYFPKLIEALPRPGKWMETFKQLMAFPLLLTVVWLLNILGKSTGLSTVIWILVGLIILAIGLWVYGKYSSQLSLSLKNKVFSYSALLICFLIFFKLSHQHIESNNSPKTAAQFPKEIHGIKYQPFDPIIALNHVKNGKNVFIDYTAVW